MRKPLPKGPEGPPGSLTAALAKVPDPRQPYGWRPEYPPIPLVALLQLTVAAMLCGARSLAAVVLGQLRSAGHGHELAAAEQVLAAVPLAGRLVTADALLTQREVSTQVVAGGGDYLLPVKENQPTLRADLQAAFFPLGARR